MTVGRYTHNFVLNGELFTLENKGIDFALLSFSRNEDMREWRHSCTHS